MRNRVCCFAFLVVAASVVFGAEAECPLSRQVKPFSAQNENRLAALVRFGKENRISFGVESFGDLAQRVTTNSGSGTALSTIVDILGTASEYDISCLSGVVVVRHTRTASPKWLDERLPLYQVKRMTFAWANANLWMQLEMLLNPGAGGFAGSMNPGDPDDLVGPFEKEGRHRA